MHRFECILSQTYIPWRGGTTRPQVVAWNIGDNGGALLYSGGDIRSVLYGKTSDRNGKEEIKWGEPWL